MSDEITKKRFRDAAASWICDGYSIEMAYLVRKEGEESHLHSAKVIVYPVKDMIDPSFQISLDSVIVGYSKRPNATRDEVLSFLDSVLAGKINILERRQVFSLFVESGSPSYFSELPHSSTWVNNLNIRVSGKSFFSMDREDRARTDDQLRMSEPPFDGLEDFYQSMGIPEDVTGSRSSSISVSIAAPISIDKCCLSNQRLEATLVALRGVDVGQVSLALKGFPEENFDSRKLISKKIRWRSQDGDVNTEGQVSVGSGGLDAAFLMLQYGGVVVQRNWYRDPERSINIRMLALACFDKDLKKMRSFALEDGKGRKFEEVVQSIFFMLGFSPAFIYEGEAPDLVMITPGGQLAIVECTIKFSDVSTKVGKLVNRRVELEKVIQASGHAQDVCSILVCQSSRDQVSEKDDFFHDRRVILYCRDDIEMAINKAVALVDPDRMLMDEKQRFLQSSFGFPK